jgi:hypothetical protein
MGFFSQHGILKKSHVNMEHLFLMLAFAWHICERSECWIVGDPEELMEESNII